MATTGSIDVNLTKVSNILNNGTQIGEGVTTGIANQSTTIGDLSGVLVIITIILVVIAALLVLIARSLGMFGGIAKNFKSFKG